tara:strand:+ start:42 stop:563 length:522 start_codon:yes stop_codon:yes gene_type:complete
MNVIKVNNKKREGVWVEVSEGAFLRVCNQITCRVYLEPELVERLERNYVVKKGHEPYDYELKEEITKYLKRLDFGGQRGTLFDHENNGENAWRTLPGLGYCEPPGAQIETATSFVFKDSPEYKKDWDKHHQNADLWAYLAEDGEGEFMGRDDITKRVAPVSDSVGPHVLGTDV